MTRKHRKNAAAIAHTVRLTRFTAYTQTASATGFAVSAARPSIRRIWTMNNDDLQYDPDSTTHPGETLWEVLDEAHALFVDNDVERGDDSPSLLSVRRCLADITPDIADALESATDVPADFWMQRQAQFDDQPTVEKLASVVRGEWEGEWRFFFCEAMTEGAGGLKYGIFRRSPGEWEPYCEFSFHGMEAKVFPADKRSNCFLPKQYDTPLAALRALVAEWGDEIERWAGTKHPSELEDTCCTE